MIVELPDTTTNAVAKALVKIREEGGAVALGRVLTLVIATPLGDEEEAIEAANDASREHPMRVIVLSKHAGGRQREAAKLDAEIRVGGDAGASEVIVLRAYGDTAADEEGLVTGLLLPDAPVVVWWPRHAPVSPSRSPLGSIAQRRITDAAAAANPLQALESLGANYAPGDTDFAWTRLTLWRAQLAAVLDQPPYEPVTGVHVTGSADFPVDRAARGVAAAAARGPGLARDHQPDARQQRHPRRPPGAGQRTDRPGTPAAERRDAHAAEPAHARHLAPPPQPARLSRRGIA